MSYLHLLLSLVAWNPEAQADVILEYYSYQEYPKLYDAWITFDNSGHLWVLGWWDLSNTEHARAYVSRISPDGNLVFDKVAISGPDMIGDPYIICDRWDAAYCFFDRDYFLTQQITTHLVRVSPDGVHHAYPSLDVERYRSHIYIIPGDTLLIIGKSESSITNKDELLVLKGILEPDMIPNLETQDKTGCRSLGDLTEFGSNYKVYIDWEDNRGIRSAIYHSSEEPTHGPDHLHLYHLNLNMDNDCAITKLGYYPWREYVWREYRNTPIGGMTFTRYSEGGYLLYIPDPLNLSNTYVVRLSEEGEPLDPENLKGGGKKQARSFTRLPEDIEAHAAIRCYGESGSVDRDSARVVFWGCDDEGNLYSYSKVKKY